VLFRSIGTELHKNFGPLFNPALSEDAKAAAKANIGKRLGYLNDQLAKRSYLVGDGFTVADAYAFTIINWTNFVGIDLKAYPNVAAYSARIAARPKVQEALRAEGLIK
jgi:glutathione S-transferase